MSDTDFEDTTDTAFVDGDVSWEATESGTPPEETATQPMIFIIM